MPSYMNIEEVMALVPEIPSLEQVRRQAWIAKDDRGLNGAREVYESVLSTLEESLELRPGDEVLPTLIAYFSERVASRCPFVGADDDYRKALCLYTKSYSFWVSSGDPVTEECRVKLVELCMMRRWMSVRLGEVDEAKRLLDEAAKWLEPVSVDRCDSDSQVGIVLLWVSTGYAEERNLETAVRLFNCGLTPLHRALGVCAARYSGLPDCEEENCRRAILRARVHLYRLLRQEGVLQASAVIFSGLVHEVGWRFTAPVYCPEEDEDWEQDLAELRSGNCLSHREGEVGGILPDAGLASEETLRIANQISCGKEPLTSWESEEVLADLLLGSPLDVGNSLDEQTVQASSSPSVRAVEWADLM